MEAKRKSSYYFWPVKKHSLGGDRSAIGCTIASAAYNTHRQRTLASTGNVGMQLTIGAYIPIYGWLHICLPTGGGEGCSSQLTAKPTF